MSTEKPKPSLDGIPYGKRGFAFEVACAAIGICPNTGRTIVRRGELVSYRIGKRHLVTGQAIDDCIAARVKASRRAVPS